MAAGRTYTPIATQTITGTVSTVTFSNIPQTYTDLVLVSSARSAAGDRVSAFYFDLNGLTSNIYSRTYLLGDGSSASSGRATSQGLGQLGTNTGTVSDGGVFAITTSHIMNYTNTNTYKTVISRNNIQQPTAGASVSAYINLVQTTAAVTSLTLYTVSSFVAGSTFTLYGIAAA